MYSVLESTLLKLLKLHTCLFKIWFIGKFLKFEIQAFIPNFRSLAQQTKKLGNVHYCAPLCTSFFQNMVYKKVYEI